MMVYIMRCLRIALDGLDHESMFLFAVTFRGWMPTSAKMSAMLLQTPTGANDEFPSILVVGSHLNQPTSLNQLLIWWIFMDLHHLTPSFHGS